MRQRAYRSGVEPQAMIDDKAVAEEMSMLGQSCDIHKPRDPKMQKTFGFVLPLTRILTSKLLTWRLEKLNLLSRQQIPSTGLSWARLVSHATTIRSV